MELRQWALHILSSSELDDKLWIPDEITDFDPGPVYFFDEPARATHLRFQKKTRNQRLPPFHEHGSEHARMLCLHRFCGHELLAVELLAFAALAYPQAPKGYRRSLIHHLREEQSHVRLYRHRLQALGSDLGHEPLFRHFWGSTGHLHSVETFISYMNLTIEQANLDFSPMFLASFLRHGDLESAKVMQTIFEDEIGHVRLGMHWIQRLIPEADSQMLYETWQEKTPPSADLNRAMGYVCHSAPRLAAGIPKAWIDQICPQASKQVHTPLERLMFPNS